MDELSIDHLPLVSVVIPSFQQGEFLAEALHSILNQGYPQLEVLVIDGGSTDGSLDVLQRYANCLTYWVSEPDRGQAHAVNKGLRRSNGKILGWLNSDDRLAPGAVLRAVEAFARFQDVDVVYGRVRRIDAAGSPIPTPMLPKDRIDFGLQQVVGEPAVNQPGCFWRRRIMDRAGLLDEGLRYALDYEYWIRIALAGGKFLRLPEVMAEFRLSPRSKTVGEPDRMALEQLRVVDDLLARPDLPRVLGLASAALARRAGRTRANLQLHVFYGYLKQRRYIGALYWLSQALRSDPLAPFERRWLDLALAGLYRRLRKP